MALPPFAVHLAEAQLGVVARRQLESGMARHRVDGLVRGPWMEPLQRGVYRIVGSARGPEQAAIAAALRAGSGATLSGPVVLDLYGIDGFHGTRSFTVLTPPGRRLRGVDFPHRRDPDPARATNLRGGVRLAGPLDALIDSTEFVDEIGVRRLRLGHDVLRWRGLLRPGELAERLRDLGQRVPDATCLDHLLGLDDQASAGDGQRTLGRLLSRFRPAPEAEAWVTPDRRVDWYFRGVRYGYEYQGSVDHATLAGRLRDSERDAELRRAGIKVGYVTAADLEDERALLATVGGSLTARAHELGVRPPVLGRGEAAGPGGLGGDS